MASSEGKACTGFLGGASYDRPARLAGMGPEFYRRALGDVRLGAGMRALDLGCGTGSLTLALAAQAHPEARLYGVDISDEQLARARERAAASPCAVEFVHASMGALPFDDDHFDVVMTSMALHAAPPAAGRCAIAERVRVLKDGGVFLLVDLGRPRPGLRGLLWLPLLLPFATNRDVWDNAYLELCRDRGLEREADGYVNSIARRQLFRKLRQAP